MPRRIIRLESRFYRGLDRTSECWMWMGARTASGYGAINVSGRSIGAHRISWQLHRGPLPAGMQVGHSCGNRACVRPEHLQARAAHG